MKRTIATALLLLLVSLAGFAQGRYLPLGINGTSVLISTGSRNGTIKDFYAEAGYAIGGRLEVSLQGGAMFEELDGENETIPNFSIGFDAAVMKQQRAVPFSLIAGVRVGFASAMPENRSIFGTNYGFSMLACHDFWIVDRWLIGVGGVFNYDRYRFDITDSSTVPSTESEERMHIITYGPALDVGFRYFEDNLLVLRTDLLWNQDAELILRLNLLLVVPSTK